MAVCQRSKGRKYAEDFRILKNRPILKYPQKVRHLLGVFLCIYDADSLTGKSMDAATDRIKILPTTESESGEEMW